MALGSVCQTYCQRPLIDRVCFCNKLAGDRTRRITYRLRVMDDGLVVVSGLEVHVSQLLELHRRVLRGIDAVHLRVCSGHVSSSRRLV